MVVVLLMLMLGFVVRRVDGPTALPEAVHGQNQFFVCAVCVELLRGA